MTRRHAFFTLLAATHLALVACGALGLALVPDTNLIGKALRAVRTASGSDCRPACGRLRCAC